MDYLDFSDFSSLENWLACLPELLCLGLGILCLLASSSSKFSTQSLGILSLTALVCLSVFVALSAFIFTPEAPRYFCFELLRQSSQADSWRFLILLAAAFVVYLKLLTHADAPPSGGEFYCLLLWTLASFLLCLNTVHFLPFFVALEAASLGLYALIAMSTSPSNYGRGGLKYLLLSALSSAFLLFGIALLYGGGSSVMPQGLDLLSWKNLHLAFQQAPHHPFLLLGTALVGAALAFKAAIVPFHAWAADLYASVSLPTVCLLSTVSKIFALGIMGLLLNSCFAPLGQMWVLPLSTLGAASLLVGSLAALYQKSHRRFMAFSGIAHSGFVLLALSAVPLLGTNMIDIIWFYLLTYLLASLPLFLILVQIKPLGQKADLRDQLRYINDPSGYLKCAWTLSWASLGGAPPLAGFFAKFLILLTLLQAELYLPFLLALAGILPTSFYSFTALRTALSPHPHNQKPPPPPLNIPTPQKCLLTLILLTLLLLGLAAPLLTPTL